MSDLLVSIIIPVYNVRSYLDECVQSAANQSYRNLEIILVNDGATDRSGNLCNAWQMKDRRIRVLHQENQGVSAARNLGIEMCTGDYIMFLDADDILDNDAIERLLYLATRDSSDIVIGSYYNYYEDQNKYGFFLDDQASQFDGVYSVEDWFLMAETNEYNLYNCFIMPCGKIFKRHLFDTSIRFPHGSRCEDDLTVYKYYLMANQISIMNESVFCYRQRSDSAMTQIDHSFHIGIDAAAERLTILSICQFDLTIPSFVFEERIIRGREIALSLGRNEDYLYYDATYQLIDYLNNR